MLSCLAMPKEHLAFVMLIETPDRRVFEADEKEDPGQWIARELELLKGRVTPDYPVVFCRKALSAPYRSERQLPQSHDPASVFRLFMWVSQRSASHAAGSMLFATAFHPEQLSDQPQMQSESREPTRAGFSA